MKLRNKLKCGGKSRRKASFGADGAVMAAATLAAAGINAAATASAAKTQSKAAVENAKTQAKVIQDQTNNNNNLQKEQLAFTRAQNQENRQQQQDIQTTLQLLAGQENMNDRMERNKMQVKYGGKPKHQSIKSPFYGGGQFQVTDGGGVIPLSITPEGYGLYELYGNDHDHYHKTKGGKYKTGVGIKFNDGSIVEGEGNQNTKQGELLYVTPYDTIFLSKHSIDGFNPTEAVKQGVHPVQAFNIQEILKAKLCLNDDGSKEKCGKHRSIKCAMGGITPVIDQANMTQNPNNGTASVASGVVYGVNQTTSPVEELQYVTPYDDIFLSKHSIDGFNPTKAVMNGANPEQAFAIQEILKDIKGIDDNGRKLTHNSIKRRMGGYSPALDQANFTQNPNNGTASVSGGVAYKVNSPTTSPVEELQYNNSIAKRGGRIHLKCGGRRKAAWGDYAGSTYNAAGNLLGAGITTLGNMIAGNRLGKAYMKAGNIISDAYSQMHGIDMSELKREDYEAPHSLAVVRDSSTNINPQLERIRRNSAAERREINRGTLSSAVRQQRLSAVNDKMMQQSSEQYAYKQNEDEKIKQANAERITQVAQANADRDVQALKDYNAQRLALLQYNNDIENTKITGAAQAKADAIAQASNIKNQAIQNSTLAFGNALTASGQAFATAYDNARKYEREDAYTYAGLSTPERRSLALSGKSPNNATRYYNEQLNIFNTTTDADMKRTAYDNILAVIDANPNLSLNLPRINANIGDGSLNTRATVNLPNKLPIFIR